MVQGLTKVVEVGVEEGVEVEVAILEVEVEEAEMAMARQVEL